MLTRIYYLHRDWLFLLALLTYILNRFAILPSLDTSYYFAHFYLNDLLFIPVMLPLTLYVEAMLGLRPKYLAPQLTEVMFYTTIWSIMCELIGPNLLGRGTADVFDIAAYLVGATVSTIWWTEKFHC